MDTASNKKSIISRVGLVSTLILLSLLLLLQGVLAACQPRTVTATINYGPFGPIELPPDKVEMLMEHLQKLSTASSENLNTEVWPLEIKFSPGDKFSMVAVYPRIIMVDGQPRKDQRPQNHRISDFLTNILLQELLDGWSFPEAFEKCDSVKLASRDEPKLELSLDSEQQKSIGSMLQELSMRNPDSGYGGAAYPDYVLTLDWNGIPESFEWTRREHITLWTEGFLGTRLTWYDPEGKVWQSLLSLLPPPLPDERQGLSKLFVATADVRASGGNLGQPVECGGWRVPLLIRILQEGQPSSDNVPTEEPVSVTFANADNEWKVYLYDNGFIFEEQYYHYDDLKMTFLGTMSAG